jgi:putative ABC transport system permease protein
MLNRLLETWRRLLFYLRRDRFDHELEEEMRFHLELKAGANLASGMASEEARYASQRQFGNRTLLREVSREMWSFRSIETLVQDLRYGARMLLKHKGITAVAVLTLALGIGANSAIFSVVNSVLLRELPYREPERLVAVFTEYVIPQVGARKSFLFTGADFRDLRDQNQSFEQAAAYSGLNFNLTGSGEPEALAGVRATANLFATLGIEPRHGRAFLPEEDRPGNNRVVILSDELWRRRFGSDPKIVGQTIILNNEPYAVIGVAPPDFRFPPKDSFYSLSAVDFYTPLALPPEEWNNRGPGRYTVIARLKSGFRIEQAQSDVVSLAKRLEERYPNTNRYKSVQLVPFHQQVVGKVETALLALLGAAGFVLLIACVNVANLLLARATARQKEIAIRAALGAGRWRVVRQLLTESILLAILAGALASLLAFWCVDLLRRVVPEDFPRAAEISVDLRVLGFTLAVSLLTGIAFGLIPALQGSRTDLNETLKEGGRSSGGRARSRLGGVFVVSEVALALLLLVGAGLMLRSFIRLMNVDPGFDPHNVLAIAIRPPETKYNSAQQAAFSQQLLERVRALPGVRSAGVVFPPLWVWENTSGFRIEGEPPPPPSVSRRISNRVVSPDYFKTLNIQLLKGRVIDENDGPNKPPVVVINETLARRYWPNSNPIGQRIFSGEDTTWREIVGVVRDARYNSLDTEAGGQVYAPFDLYAGVNYRTLVVRADGDPLGLVPAVLAEIKAIDKDQPISSIHTMEEMMAKSVSQRRFNMLLLAIFAGVALLMAVVGIYGVMSYSVGQRTHEIGLRMALGANTADVLRLLLGQGMKLVVMGMAIGLAAAIALTRLISSLLFDVHATDPATFVAISLLLALVALLACYVPARRAAKVDPVVALRLE